MKTKPDTTTTTKTTAPDKRTARLRILTDNTAARGFTFAKGAEVDGVPLAHAEYLVAAGSAQILEVSNQP